MPICLFLTFYPTINSNNQIDQICLRIITQMQQPTPGIFSEIKTIEVKQWPCQLLQMCYDICEGQLGHGTYGSVYKARNLNDDKYYALKKMEHLQDKNQMGFPITTIREIKILQGLNHPNILNIKEVVYQKGRNYKPPVIYISLDLMECDILELIKSQSFNMTPFKIQHILKQVLKGLQYLHKLNISHRDIKPSNILISEFDQIKIADFGLAKKLKKLSTTKVVTMWYRAPQLLLGVRSYTPKVDIWSVGCVAAELLLRRPLFQDTSSETEIMKRIFELTGTPDKYGLQQQLSQEGKNYPQLKPNFSCESTIMYYLKQKAAKFQQQYELLDLIERMLRVNHHSRFSASQCLAHDFFNIEFPPQQTLSSDFLEQLKTQKEHTSSMKKKIKLI